MPATTPQVSRYLPIWNELKDKKKCRLVAPITLHPRIIKAVKKRKDRDIAYSYQLAENCQKAKLHFKSNGNVIEITLHISIGLSEL